MGGGGAQEGEDIFIYIIDLRCMAETNISL